MAIATSGSTNAPLLDKENSVDDVNKKMNNINEPKVSKFPTEEDGENILSSSAMTQIEDPASQNVYENGCESNGSGTVSEENDMLEAAEETDANGVVGDAKKTDANVKLQANGLEIKTDGFCSDHLLENEDGGDCAPTGSGDSSNYSESVSSPAANESAVLHGDDTSGEKLSRTNLYIRGLGEDFNDKKLFDLCRKFGQIVSTKAIMHKQSMICKGYGFVDFSTEEEARRAVVELQNQGIPAQMARQQEQDLTNIYISNLPKSFDEKKLETVFQKFGTVVSTRILRDQNGVTKRVGFVRMESQEMCESVIAKVHNKPLEDYPDCKLLCKFADAGKRRKPFYSTSSVPPGAGIYDHFDHTYHQHNHHSYNYSNHHHHQSAYNSSLYANFPKGYNHLGGHSASGAGGASGVSPHAANITLNGVWSSSAAAAAPSVAAANFGAGASGLNAMASTASFANYYNLLLTNPNAAAAAAALSLGAVTNNVGSAAVLAGTGPLGAAASLGGAPFFQNPAVAAAAANQLASPAANSAANHASMVNSPNSSASYLNNSHSSQHSEASTMQTSSHVNNQQQQSTASAVNNAGPLVGGTNVGGSSAATTPGQGGTASAAEFAAAFYQQSAAAHNPHPHFLSNISHSMHHMSLQQQQQLPRGSAASHQQNNSASNSSSSVAAAANLNNRTVSSTSMFNNGPPPGAAGNGALQAMFQHANSSTASPLDTGNQSSSTEDASVQRAAAAAQQQYNLNGAVNSATVNNGVYTGGAHMQMATPSAAVSVSGGGGVSSQQQQQNAYWAAMMPPAAAQHQAAAAHYHAALVQQAQQQTTNDNPAANSAVAQTGSAAAAAANSNNIQHLFAYNRGAAAANVNNAQVQF